jgi:hypothetical protein
MKRKRYSEEQIGFALRQAESGTAVAPSNCCCAPYVEPPPAAPGALLRLAWSNDGPPGNG